MLHNEFQPHWKLKPRQVPDQPSTNPTGSSILLSPSPTPVSSSPPTTNNPEQTSPLSSFPTINPTSTTQTQDPILTFSNPQTTFSPTSTSPLPTNDQSTSASFFSPSTSSTLSPSATVEPPPQSTSISTTPAAIPPSSIQSSPSSILTTSNPLPTPNSQTVQTTSSFLGTTTDLDGTIHTYTTYVDVYPTSILGNGSKQTNGSWGILNNGETQHDGFFDRKGAVIGTFFTLGLLVLAGLTALLWRFTRLRKAKLRSKSDPDGKFDTFIANDLDDPDGRKAMLPLQLVNDEELRDLHVQPENHPHVNDSRPGASMDHQGFYYSDSGTLGMPLTYPVRFSGRSQAKGRASDLDTLNTVEWGQYVNTHFSPGRDSGLAGVGKSDLMRMEKEGRYPSVPTRLSHPPGISPIPQHEVQTVEQEDFAMINSPTSDSNDHFYPGDERLKLMALPTHKNQSRESSGSPKASSLRDEEDYSRRILKVSNPDVEDLVIPS